MALNGNEPTPNREQRVLAHFAEVRRRKTVGQWHSLVNSLNGKPTFGYFLSFSSRRLRLPLYAIKGVARMSLNAIKLKKFSAFRFAFSVFC